VKRSDLTVGAEVYYAKPSDWDGNRGCKAIVLATEPHGTRRFERGDARFYPNGRGAGVLVELHKPGWDPRRDVVPLGHLRGPYAETAAVVEEQAARHRDYLIQQEAKRKAIRASADAVASRAREAGFRVHGVLQGGDLIAIRPDVLATMLDRIEGGA
jgi:hypothetical protein